jgi:hypothetical protein
MGVPPPFSLGKGFLDPIFVSLLFTLLFRSMTVRPVPAIYDLLPIRAQLDHIFRQSSKQRDINDLTQRGRAQPRSSASSSEKSSRHQRYPIAHPKHDPDAASIRRHSQPDYKSLRYFRSNRWG